MLDLPHGAVVPPTQRFGWGSTIFDLSLDGLCVTLAVGLLASPVHAAELRLDLQQFNRLTGQIGPPEDRLRADPSRPGFATERIGRFMPEDLWYSTVVRAGARLTMWQHYALTVQFDTGELRPVGRRPAILAFRATDGPRPNLIRVVETIEDDTQATAGGQPIVEVPDSKSEKPKGDPSPPPQDAPE